jgi:hypothetical protein
VQRVVRASAAVGQAIDHAAAIGVGLLSTNAPQPGIAQRIVEVHGVLRRNHDAHAEGSRLFHERHQWALGWRIAGVGRHEAVHRIEHVLAGATNRGYSVKFTGENRVAGR